MIEIKYKNTDKYYWCAWGGDVCHFGELNDGQVVTTGQPNLENYSTETELSIKVDDLKGANYYYVHTTDKPVIDDSKAEIQAWLTEHGIDFGSSNTKAKLLELI